MSREYERRLETNTKTRNARPCLLPRRDARRLIGPPRRCARALRPRRVFPPATPQRMKPSASIGVATPRHARQRRRQVHEILRTASRKRQHAGGSMELRRECGVGFATLERFNAARAGLGERTPALLASSRQKPGTLGGSAHDALLRFRQEANANARQNPPHAAPHPHPRATAQPHARRGHAANANPSQQARAGTHSSAALADTSAMCLLRASRRATGSSISERLMKLLTNSVRNDIAPRSTESGLE